MKVKTCQFDDNLRIRWGTKCDMCYLLANKDMNNLPKNCFRKNSMTGKGLPVYKSGLHNFALYKEEEKRVRLEGMLIEKPPEN